MQIIAPTQTALPDDLPLRVSGGAPGEKITLQTSLADRLGTTWRSLGAYVADDNGDIHTGRDPSLGGTYLGIDVGGPFWSMRPDTQRSTEARAAYCQRVLRSPALPLMPELEPLGAMRYDIVARDEKRRKRASARLERQRLRSEIATLDRLPGRLRGQAFLPGSAPSAGVLVLGGSEGGLLPARAAALAGEGFVTLALGYFDYADRPGSAIDLPLEYFAEALAWLRERCPRTAVWGSSRGAEAALLTACHFPQLVDAAVGWVPSHLVNSGLDLTRGADFSREQRAMWSLNGKPVPGVALLPPDAALPARDFATFPGHQFADEFLARWDALPAGSAFDLPLDDLRAPLFLAAGADDGLWPAAYGARRIEQALADRPVAVTVSVYDDAGHMIGVPNEVRPFSDVVHWSNGYAGVESGLVHYGGTPAGNARAARRSWREVVGFLREHLSSGASAAAIGSAT